MSERQVTPYVEPKTGPTDAPRTYTRRQVFVRRVLFWLGIVAFVIVASLPLLLVTLSMRGEFTFGVPGDFPENQARVWMVMEPNARGIAYSWPRLAAEGTDLLQVETTVRYLLWEGENEVIRYCQTYTRSSSDDPWSMAEMDSEACLP